MSGLIELNKNSFRNSVITLNRIINDKLEYYIDFQKKDNKLVCFFQLLKIYFCKKMFRI